jgi:hypothetical protein
MAGGAVSGGGGSRVDSYTGGVTLYVILVAIIGGSSGWTFGLDNG